MIPEKAKIIFSRHAKERMRERKIGDNEVLNALLNPVQIVYDSWNDVYIAVSGEGKAVVYAFRGSVVEILTVLGKREYEALLSKFNRRYKVLM